MPPQRPRLSSLLCRTQQTLDLDVARPTPQSPRTSVNRPFATTDSQVAHCSCRDDRWRNLWCVRNCHDWKRLNKSRLSLFDITTGKARLRGECVVKPLLVYSLTRYTLHICYNTICCGQQLQVQRLSYISAVRGAGVKRTIIYQQLIHLHAQSVRLEPKIRVPTKHDWCLTQLSTRECELSMLTPSSRARAGWSLESENAGAAFRHAVNMPIRHSAY